MYGPFGNLFPYSDQHALNLDWIIQVAKDFLDQYTHIQEIISDGETSLDQHTTEGLAALAAEKTRLEGLLDAWYTTHSEDIAGQLTQALTDFQAAATAIGSDVLESIPDDYTALSTSVSDNVPNAIAAAAGFRYGVFGSGYYSTPDVGDTSALTSSPNYVTCKLPATTTDYVEFSSVGGTSTQRQYAVLDSDSKVLYRSVADKTGKITPNMSNYPTAAYIVVNCKIANRASAYLFVGPSVLSALAGKQNTLTFDTDPKPESSNPVKSGGVFYQTKALAETAGNSFTGFIQKNINATTGELTSTGASDTITEQSLIPIDTIFACTSNYENINVYMYTADGSYIGNTGANQKSFISYDYIDEIKTDNPTAKYVRIRFGNSTHPVTISNYKEQDVQLITLNNIGVGKISKENLSMYETDGVLTPSGDSTLEFGFTIPFNGDHRNQIFTCIAKYEQAENVTAVPTIIFRYGNTLDRTTEYIIGNKDDYDTKQWRVIRYPGVTTDLTVLFKIPVGVILTIQDFYNEYNDEVNRVTSGIRFNGHQVYLPNLLNPDTLPAVRMAVKAGACAMIQIPKRLSDGKWIFYHDDTLIYNDTYIRQADGSTLPDTYNGTAWSSIDYDTASSWDWGISKGSMFAGTKPMLMEEFFNICGKTGIMPMLSIHPWPGENTAEIKAIAKKCGVLNKLGIKVPASRIADAYAVFGNDVESYTIDVSSGTQTATTINAAITAMDRLTDCTVRRVIELFASTAYNAYFGESTYDPFKLISDAGYGCSLAMQRGEYHPTLPNSNNNILKGSDINYWQAMGVCEYTYEYDWSTGLNW